MRKQVGQIVLAHALGLFVHIFALQLNLNIAHKLFKENIGQLGRSITGMPWKDGVLGTASKLPLIRPASVLDISLIIVGTMQMKRNS